jgi:hypothetical protein
MLSSDFSKEPQKERDPIPEDWIISNKGFSISDSPSFEIP